MSEVPSGTPRGGSPWSRPYPWPRLRTILDGLSAIDVPSLNIQTREEARGFLAGYGFDLERPRDRAHAAAIHGEAVAFITRYFLGGHPHVPTEVTHPADISDILVMASDESNASRRTQAWACAVLRVMHTIAHCDDDLRLHYFKEIRGQILESYTRHIAEDGDRIFLGRGDDRVPLCSFRVKERKDRDSVIMKLLHKPGNVAEEIYDRIGVRLVTPTRVDALLALRYLRDHQIFSFANIQPEQSKNALLDLARFLAALDEAGGDASDATRARLEEALLLPAGTLIRPEQDPGQRNPHSLEGYRAIQFTARQRVHVIPRGRTRLKAANVLLEAARRKSEDLCARIETLASAAPAETRTKLEALAADARGTTDALDEAEQHADPVGIDEELSFFFPYEVHILDDASDRQNETGLSSHVEYKHRQMEAARRRVMGKLL
ncbi:MAG: TIGR04552 family protein [Acidobacteriota bacterium]